MSSNFETITRFLTAVSVRANQAASDADRMSEEEVIGQIALVNNIPLPPPLVVLIDGNHIVFLLSRPQIPLQPLLRRFCRSYLRDPTSRTSFVLNSCKLRMNMAKIFRTMPLFLSLTWMPYVGRVYACTSFAIC